MTESDLACLRADLTEAEGCRLKVYADTKGIETIGIGRNIRDKGISKTTALQMLDEDINESLSDLRAFPWFLTLDGVRMRAVIEIRFALGAAGFRGFVKMIAALAKKDYDTAASELALSKAASHDWQPSRSVRLIKMLRTGTV